jgi:hypothetical protein
MHQHHVEIELRPGMRRRRSLAKRSHRACAVGGDAPAIFVATARHVDAVEIAGRRRDAEPSERSLQIRPHAAPLKQHLSKRQMRRAPAQQERPA